MLMFWLLAGLMLLVAVIVLLPALLGRGHRSAFGHDDSNIAIYQERDAELHTALVNGDLTQTEFDAARKELESHLLEDVSDAATQPVSAARKPAWGTLAVIAISLPLASFGLYAQLGTPRLSPTPQASQPVAAPAQAEAAMHSIEDMVSGLAERLQQQPDDGAGWAMLGRSYVALQRPDDAVLAFAKAHQLLGDQAKLLADFAEALTLANDDKLAGQPMRLVTRALELEPDNPKALWLAGVAAMQRGDNDGAVNQWQRLVTLLPPGSQETQTLKQHIAQIGGNTNSTAKTTATATAAPAATAISQQTVTAQTATASLQVSVSLDVALAAKADPNATVFIFARASQGPRVPLAIARHQASELPVSVTLDDSMAMAPNFKLSLFPEVIVGARISKSGDALAQSGDLEGYSQPLRVDSAGLVQVTINRIVP